MKLDNAKRAGYIKLVYMAVPLVIVVSAALTYLFFDVKDLRYIILGIVLVVLFFLVMSIFKFTYIVFYAGPDKVQIRFKKLSAFNTPNSSVKILAENFRNYEITKSLKGMRTMLYLYQETPSGLAKYPGIGLTALNATDVDKIRKALELILAMNKSKNQ